MTVGERLEKVCGSRWAIALVLAAGLAWRLAHLVYLQRTHFYSSLILDARYNDRWAQEIVGGSLIGSAPFWVDPLYAYVLAAIYGLFGRDLLVPRLLNFAMGLATAAVSARLARRLWGSNVAAVVTAVVVVGFVPSIHFEASLEKTALTMLLLALAVERFLDRSDAGVAASGLCVGLATLARGNSLILLPFGAVALLLGWERGEGEAAGDRRQRIARAATFVGCALPILLLATMHNLAASGELIPTTSNFGINLYLGNHSGNEHGYYSPPPFLRALDQTEIIDFRAEAEKRTARTFSDGELSSYWADQAWAEMRSAPSATLWRFVHKLQLLVNDHEIPDTDDVAIVGEWSPWLRSPVFWFGQVFPFALLGSVVGWRHRRVRVVAVTVLIWASSLLPFFVMARLRIQIVPVLAALAAGGLVRLGGMLQSGDLRRLAVAGVVLVLGCAATYTEPDWMAKRRLSALAIGWYMVGHSLEETDRPDAAIAAYERAVAIDGASVPIVLRLLGLHYQRQGDFVRAEAMLRRLVEVRPDSRLAVDSLRNLYETMLADPRWQHDGEIRQKRARVGLPPE